MSDPKTAQSLANPSAAIRRPAEAVDQAGDDPIKADAVIHRFEFVIELFWKTLKRMLADELIQATTPKEALQQAFKAGWLDRDGLWLGMLKDRIETSHIHNEQMARRVSERIRLNLPEIRKATAFLVERSARQAT